MLYRILVLLILLAAKAHARVPTDLTLYTWQVAPNHPKIIIAVRPQESPSQALIRYLRSVSQHWELSQLSGVHELNRLRRDQLEPLSSHDFEKRTLLIANRPTDLTPGDWRVPSFADQFRQEGLESYIVPFAADAGLTPLESWQLSEQLNREFLTFVAMGGDDIDLRQINDQQLHPTSKVNARRDQWEITLLKRKLEILNHQRRSSSKKHRLVAVCRGAQLVAALMGYRIRTHIDSHGPDNDYKVGDQEPLHTVRLLPTAYSHLLKASGNRERIQVNSYHHQAIEFSEGKGLELAAVSPDGVVEGLESTDGTIVLKQFHSELMAIRSLGELSTFGQQFMKFMANFLKPCENLLTTPALN